MADLTKIEGAIRYALVRVQTDPDYRYYMLVTETMSRLVSALCEITGEDHAAAIARYSEDHQPPHRRYRPEVLVLRERCLALTEALYQIRDAGTIIPEGLLQ